MQPESPIQQEPETNETPSLQVQEVKQPEHHMVEEAKKTPKRNVSIPVMAGLLIVLCLAVVGLGFWAYKLNVNLTEANQQLTSLQSEQTKLQSDYAKLKSENEKLTSDLAQAKTDIEKANKNLAAAQADLKQSKDQNKNLQDKLTAASKNAEILYLFATGSSTTDILKIDDLVKETNDQKLISQWDTFTSSPTTKSSADFLLYMLEAIRDSLKN